MTHEEKINYMQIASAIVGYNFNTKSLDMLVSIYELVIENKGKTDLDKITEVKFDVERRADLEKDTVTVSKS